MIKIENLTKKFDDIIALSCVNIDIETGSIVGLIGPNGSGKSTLLRCLCGVYKPDAGNALYNDEEIFENTEIKSEVFFISDDFYFLPHSNMLSLATMYSKIYKNWSWQKFNDLCAIFPINPQKKVQNFSKGMKRQVSIILGLSACPKLILLDEAFDGLDPIVRQDFRKVLCDEVLEHKTTVVISSHNLRELEDICDHVVFITKGQIILNENINTVKDNMCKVMVAFKPMVEESILRETIKIKKLTVNGSIINIVALENYNAVTEKLEKLNPVLCEAHPLTLEEIFSSEMEGINNEK